MVDGIGQFKVGTKIKSQGRTITEGDYSTIVNVSWETSALHTDREYMKGTQFGDIILGGPCIIPFVAGLSSAGIVDLVERSGLRTVALVGIENAHFTAPLYPGDTMRVETEVVGFRPTSKPRRYLGRLKSVAYKQDGRAILEMERIVLLEKIS